MTAPLFPPSDILSNGNNKLHAAVSVKTAAETNTGNDGEMPNSAPAETGAMTPVLYRQLTARRCFALCVQCESLTVETRQQTSRTLFLG